MFLVQVFLDFFSFVLVGFYVVAVFLIGMQTYILTEGNSFMFNSLFVLVKVVVMKQQEMTIITILCLNLYEQTHIPG